MRLKAFFALMISVAPSWAQEFRSIRETIDGQSDDFQSQAYVNVRCSGLFNAAASAGRDLFSPQIITEYEQAAEIFVAGAAFIRVTQQTIKGTGSYDMVNALQSASDQAESISNIYLERFNSNYNVTGVMFDNDTLANDDLQTCNAVLPDTADIVSNGLAMAEGK